MGAPAEVRARWWHRYDQERIQCDLCPRGCRLREGQRGLCFQRTGGKDALLLSGYGRTSAIAVDPVEKKPLFHFYPGSRVLSFGTIGCSFACAYCQNWEISQARSPELLVQEASPRQMAQAAVAAGCHGVAFTYNEPIVFAEFACDCADAAHGLGLTTVAVSNGYIQGGAREEFFAHMDAANIDLKAMSPEFYRQVCRGRLEPVLETLRWLHEESPVWLEVTNLVVPGMNDADEEIGALCDWYRKHLGEDVPLHFSAYHPSYRMREPRACPAQILLRARAIALTAGIRYVYAGNISDPAAQATYCARCGARLIERLGYATTIRLLTENATCSSCGNPLPGRFDHFDGADDTINYIDI